MTILSSHCTALWLSLNHGNIEFEKIRERRESNPGQLGDGARTLPMCYAAPPRAKIFSIIFGIMQHFFLWAIQFFTIIEHLDSAVRGPLTT
jgi:hypothetical protein